MCACRSRRPSPVSGMHRRPKETFRISAPYAGLTHPFIAAEPGHVECRLGRSRASRTAQRFGIRIRRGSNCRATLGARTSCAIMRLLPRMKRIAWPRSPCDCAAAHTSSRVEQQRRDRKARTVGARAVLPATVARIYTRDRSHRAVHSACGQADGVEESFRTTRTGSLGRVVTDEQSGSRRCRRCMSNRGGDGALDTAAHRHWK